MTEHTFSLWWKQVVATGDNISTAWPRVRLKNRACHPFILSCLPKQYPNFTPSLFCHQTPGVKHQSPSLTALASTVSLASPGSYQQVSCKCLYKRAHPSCTQTLTWIGNWLREEPHPTFRKSSCTTTSSSSCSISSHS